MRTLRLDGIEELALVGDGCVVLVRDPYPALSTFDPFGTTPSEFVLACAPCETCGDTRSWFSDGPPQPCDDCRIELVVPCPLCRGTGKWVDCDFACNDCEGTTTMPLGYAYAVGQPDQRPDGKWALELAVQP